MVWMLQIFILQIENKLAFGIDHFSWISFNEVIVQTKHMRHVEHHPWLPVYTFHTSAILPAVLLSF